MLRIGVVLVAAGQSTRLPGVLPKTLREMGGVPVVRLAAQNLAKNAQIHAIQPVVRAGDEADVNAMLSGVGGVLPAIAGGEQRQDSVRAGLEALKNQGISHVLIHDAARPMVPAEMLERLITALQTQDAVIPVLKVADTIKRVSANEVIETLPREQLVAVQTPQAFKFSVIYDVHQRLAGDALTDDAALCEAAGVPVATVAGDASARKLTTPEDWQAMEKGAGMSERICVGHGVDVHALKPYEEGDSSKQFVRLGGVAIPCSHYLEGHSDGDVVLHAIVDAILGALGEGDIGEHFSPDDPEWRGADSARFVIYAAKLLRECAASIQNVDVTVMCEFPKITPHKAAMREKIAELLGLELNQVSVKATTTEKLGFLGRSEGIGAMATACVKRKV